MELRRLGKDRRAVRGVGHHVAHARAHPREAAIDGTHEHACDYARARDLARHPAGLPHPEVADVFRDDQPERQGGEKVHRLVARQGALNSGVAVIGRLRGGDASGRDGHGGGHHSNDQHDEGRAGHAAKKAGNAARVHGHQVGDREERDREHEQRRRGGNLLGQQGREHLERRCARARDSEARPDGQVDRPDENAREPRVDAPRELAGGSGERHRHDARHRKPDGRHHEADHGRHALVARLQAQQRRKDKVARPEEHREKRDADHERLPRGKALRSL